jgi:hypothetical protein
MRSRKGLMLAGFWAVLVVLAVHLLQFPGSVPDFNRASGGGVLLDAMPAFTPDKTYERLAAYGEPGRRNYSFRNVTVDVILPLSVLPFLVLLIRRAIVPFSFGRATRAVLLLIPVLYVALDLLENASVLALLATYPERMNPLAASLPYTTVLKRAASLLAIALPLLMMGIQFVRVRRLPAATQS